MVSFAPRLPSAVVADILCRRHNLLRLLHLAQVVDKWRISGATLVAKRTAVKAVAARPSLFVLAAALMDQMPQAVMFFFSLPVVCLWNNLLCCVARKAGSICKHE